MENFRILTEVSPWYIFLCILAALGYAFLLYKRNSNWGTRTTRILFGIRFLTTFILFFLLTGPLLKFIKNYLEKPAIVIAIDDSQSITLGQDSSQVKKLKENLLSLSQKLKDEDYEVVVQTLSEPKKTDEISGLRFNNKSTNISKLLSDIKSNYENRNLAGVILPSDGIFNEGIDPTYEDYNFPIHTVALGDPNEKKDISIKAVRYNKISYAGNKFPIVLEVANNGFSGNINISISRGGKVIEKKILDITGKSISEIQFILSEDKPGMQHYEVVITPLEGEYSKANNEGHAYIEIINDKEKILIVALTPHPDVKALRSALESKQNYQVDLHIPGLNKLKEDKYDLVILHQLPDLFNQYAGVEKIINSSNGIFFITGNQSQIAKLNSINPLLEINVKGNQKDNATPFFNSSFEKFSTSADEINIINDYPPLKVPFGQYHLKGESDVVLYQQIGRIKSDNPLLICGVKEGKKYAVLTGEGIWQWRISEAQATKEKKVFDKLFTNLAQYLSAKEDKRKFRLFNSQNEYNENENVRIYSEVYNDVFERIYDKKIEIALTDENGKIKQYSFINSQGTPFMEIKGLKPGLYNYSGKVVVDNKIYTSKGAFIIKEIVLEALNITANHNLLKSLSAKSNGNFYAFTEMDNLLNNLLKLEKPSVIHSNEEFQEFINLPWIFFLIIILISIEWGVRKYNGGY